MARPKKGADGLYRRNFTYEGKKYSVRAKNPKELSQKVTAKIRALENKQPVLTVTAWAGQWLLAYNSNLRSANYERTRGILVNHLCAHIGQMELCTVRPLNLQQVLNHLAQDQSHDTVKHVQQTMKRLFESAKENHLITENPANGLTLPAAPNRRATGLDIP